MRGSNLPRYERTKQPNLYHTWGSSQQIPCGNSLGSLEGAKNGHATRSVTISTSAGFLTRCGPAIGTDGVRFFRDFLGRRLSRDGKSTRSPIRAAMSNAHIKYPNRAVGVKLLRVNASIPRLEMRAALNIGAPVLNRAVLDASTEGIPRS